MNIQITEFALQNERDCNWAAQRARLLGLLGGLPQRRLAALGKAVGEVARCAVRQGQNGTITFAVVQGEELHAIEAVARFKHSTARPTDGMTAEGDVSGRGQNTDTGLDLAERLVDEFSNHYDPGSGTVIRLTQALPAGTEPLAENVAAEWSTALATRSTQGALVNSQKRICELTEKLLVAQRHGVDLEHELQEIKSLNETLELLALVASKTENAVIILDALGQVDWVNDSFAGLTGHELSQVRGTGLGNVLFDMPTDQADKPDVSRVHMKQKETLERSLSSGHGITQEIQQRRPNGELFWASVSVTPVFDDSGEVTRWIGIANDVTKWHEAQNALQQAKDVAEATSQAKSDFLANMSHEIRTPMNVIMGMTELTLGSDLSPEQREYLSAVKNSADSLLWLLNDVLDLSKIEAGRLQLESVRFRLSELLDESLMPMSTQARVRGLNLSWTLAPEIPPNVIGDPGRLQQVLINLVSNAIKFTESGEVVVSVGADSQVDRQVDLHFAVHDTGIGIPVEKQESIFESFTQADTSTTRRFGGTGLGLSISSQLTELMGGRMWVESEVGEGSTFHFVARVLVPEMGDAGDEDAMPSTAVATWRRLRVLVVDDNPANCLLAARILEKRGHVVVQVDNGKEALELAGREDFDVVLMDAQMPGMDGFQATAALRDMEKKTEKHLPVIALTASAMKGDRERCLAAGMDAYLSKPVNSHDLERLVETLGTDALPASAIVPAVVGDRTAVDFSVALARLENDKEILKEQMRMFLEDSPALLARIRSAIADAKPDELKIASHRLKGFAATFDAERVVQTALRLEELGGEKNLLDAATVYAELESNMRHFWRQLNQYLKTTDDPQS